MDRGTWQATVLGSQKSRTRLSDFTDTYNNSNGPRTGCWQGSGCTRLIALLYSLTWSPEASLEVNKLWPSLWNIFHSFISNVQLFAIPRTVAARLLHPGDSSGKNTWVGCHALLQGIFRTQGSNPGLLGWQILYHLSHQGHPLSSIQLLSCVQLFVTPWTTARQASLSITNSQLAQTHVHWVSDAIQPSHPLSSHSLPAFNLSQHQGLFQWVSSSNQLAKVLELQLQYQSFQWIFRLHCCFLAAPPLSLHPLPSLISNNLKGFCAQKPHRVLLGFI